MLHRGAVWRHAGCPARAGGCTCGERPRATGTVPKHRNTAKQGQKRESILFPAQGADLSDVEEKEGPGRLAETEGFEPSIRLESV